MPRMSEIYARRLARWQEKKNKALMAMGNVIEQSYKEVLSTPYPPASRRGEAPRLRTGFLRQSAGVKVDLARGSIQLVNTAPYWKYLRATRPAQDIALDRARPQLDEIEQRLAKSFGED